MNPYTLYFTLICIIPKSLEKYGPYTNYSLEYYSTVNVCYFLKRASLATFNKNFLSSAVAQ